MDPYRLPQHVVPTRYELRLEPELASSTFQGEETIVLTVKEVTTEIVLNAAELQITSATVMQGTGVTQHGSITLDDKTERCRIAFPSSIAPGTWSLRLIFNGTLNDKLRGFYRSKYKDASGAERYLAATQFEATDARRAFPCWDEPAFKAVFATTLVIDPALTAVSNSAILSQFVEGGKKVVRFADTIPMSTYLVAFVVGELEATEAVLVGKTPLRVWSVPGKGKLTGFAREIGAFSLQFFEMYYDYRYPGDKLDLLAIPDFAAGAMENFGAITFRETALLVDEEAATHAELERVADVVAHENAHMWFGDLVTMSWWNGLWLNEAFATFMEMLAVDAWKPHWQRWTSFGVSRAAALLVDGLHHTRPIEFAVQAPNDADAMFDVLTYEKGASVLRMFEQYLGPEAFRNGIRRYLRKHAFGSTETVDLWTALGEATGQPMPEIMAGWVFKPGYPVITVRLDGDGRLHLAQQRFHYLPINGQVQIPRQPPSNTGDPLWQVPIQLRITAGGKVTTQRLLLSDPEMCIELPPQFESAVVNHGGHGFYRVRYSPDLLERLLPNMADSLAPIERFNLVNDAWATTLAGLMPLLDYLELTTWFRAEQDKNVWAVLINSFQYLNRILDPGERPRMETLVRNRIKPLAAELGWAPRPGESELIGQLRGDLLRTLGTLGNDAAVQSRAAEIFDEFLSQPRSVDANVAAAVIAILGYCGDSVRYNDFVQRFRSAKTPQEEQRYLQALTSFRQNSLIEQTLAKTLNGEIRTQDAPAIIRSLLMSVDSRELAWCHVKTHWDEMNRAYPVPGIRRMCEGITGLATAELERDVHQFITARKIELGGKTLQQYLEQLRIAVVFRDRERAGLHEYLAQV